MSADRLLATIRSLSPLATRTGTVIRDRSSGAALPPLTIAFSWASRACIEIFLSRSKVRCWSRVRYADAARFPSVGAGEEQEFARVFPGQEGLGIGNGDDFAHLGDPAATARSGARENHSSD